MSSSSLLAVHVSVKVKVGTEDAFKAASIANATKSVQEPGVSRFDVIQDVSDPKNFTLVEVYNSPDAPAQHKETAHYAEWRDTVADMMAEPRTNVKYTAICPSSEDGWKVPSGLSSGEQEAGEATDLIDVHVFVTVKEGCEAAFTEASIENATNSIQEEGVCRFDLIQDKDNSQNFCLVEVYTNSDAPAKHKETAHYNKWRESVADMMAVPRTNTKFVNVFPKTAQGWTS